VDAAVAQLTSAAARVPDAQRAALVDKLEAGVPPALAHSIDSVSPC